ncbi:sigma-70 family RNA polymerase sigma factor [Telmatobacter sp. DSM 110680]|uniref:RNA polymerase sigma factor n=1 Tax=Telmatobacter sp. DSM 110680 TaxID=3036704 RepID=A0AAU7DIX3_9BACT
MRWPVRLIRDARESAPGDRRLVPFFDQVGIFGLKLAAAEGDGIEGHPMIAMSSQREDDGGKSTRLGSVSPGEPGTGKKPVNGAKSDPETDEYAQPSEEDGVPDDMATLVLDNPALGHGAPLNASDPQKPINYAIDESSDAAIMLRVAAGDETGFNYLVGKYHRAMISFLFRMVHNQAVAEELAQEVFLRVYRSRESYRAEAKFTTWLYRIATNLAVNHARDTRHERSASTVYLDAPDEESGTTPDVADDTPSVEQSILRDERMAAIRAHVMALPERQRMAVLMHKYQGMDYRQIGDVLKLSESATKSLLFRAYQTLRDKLKDFV